MKKMINGKRYDTKTAALCGWREYGESGGSDYILEKMYQKRTGEFFLYGKGGSGTKYRKEIHMNDWVDGEQIIPLTNDEARKWAEEYLDPEDYEKIFTIPEENSDEKKIQTFYLSGDVRAKLTRLAWTHGMSRTQIVEDLVRAVKE